MTAPIRRRRTAVLLNALVFPGVGHWMLGYKIRGTLLALAALATMLGPMKSVVSELQTALLQLLSTTPDADITQVIPIVERIWAAHGQAATIGMISTLLIWMFAIVDASRLTRGNR